MPLTRRPCRWLGRLRASPRPPAVVHHVGGIDEGAQRTSFTSSKGQSAHPFADSRIWKTFFVEVGSDHSDRLRFFSKSPQLIHNFRIALLLESPHEIFALRRTVGRSLLVFVQLVQRDACALFTVTTASPLRAKCQVS